MHVHCEMSALHAWRSKEVISLIQSMVVGTLLFIPILSDTYIQTDRVATKCEGYLGSESTEEGKNELRESEGKVLVEEVTEEDSHSMVGPATVDQQQALQISGGRGKREKRGGGGLVWAS